VALSSLPARPWTPGGTRTIWRGVECMEVMVGRWRQRGDQILGDSGVEIEGYAGRLYV
jgi:hypothetical protein